MDDVFFEIIKNSGFALPEITNSFKSFRIVANDAAEATSKMSKIFPKSKKHSRHLKRYWRMMERNKK